MEEPLRHYLHDYRWDGRSEKSMEKWLPHLLETSPFIEPAKFPNLKRRSIFKLHRPLNPARTLTLCLLLVLGAMFVLQSLRLFVPSLLCLRSVSAALQIVPGAAWTDVSPRIQWYTIIHVSKWSPRASQESTYKPTAQASSKLKTPTTWSAKTNSMALSFKT